MANDKIDIDALMRMMNSGGSRFEGASSGGKNQKYGSRSKQDSGGSKNRQNGRNGGNSAGVRGQNGDWNRDRKKGFRTAYVGAPYNFVPFQKPVEAKQEEEDALLTEEADDTHQRCQHDAELVSQHVQNIQEKVVVTGKEAVQPRGHCGPSHRKPSFCNLLLPIYTRLLQNASPFRLRIPTDRDTL